MQRGMRRLLVVLVMLAGLTGGPRSAPPVALAGSLSQQQDACPEPNDEFQAACSFGGGGEVLGYIGHPDDVDAYRFEALDFDATASVVVPFPYQAVIADWRGDVVAASMSVVGDGEQVAAPLLVPGTYYVFVRSRTSDVNADQPYRLAISLDYAGLLHRSSIRATTGTAVRTGTMPSRTSTTPAPAESSR